MGSVGLESGADYLRGCFQQQFDLALQRDIRLGETRRLSFRIDAFNVFNQSHITGRNTTMQVASQTDPTILNLPFDASGNLLSTVKGRIPLASAWSTATNRREPCRRGSGSRSENYLPAPAPCRRSISCVPWYLPHVPGPAARAEIETLRGAEKSFAHAALDKAIYN